MQEHDELEDVAIEGRGVEEVEALIVGEERVCTVLEKKVHDVVVAALRSP